MKASTCARRSATEVNDPRRSSVRTRMKSAGEPIPPIIDAEDVRVYRGDPSTCWDCPDRTDCTHSFDGRIIHHSLFIEYIE